MKPNILAVAVASMLFGGLAVAAWQNQRQSVPIRASAANTVAASAIDPVNDAAQDIALLRNDFVVANPPVAAPARGTQPQAYAQVIDVDPVTRRRQLYATVLTADPVRESVSTPVSRQVCEDVLVQERLPERDGNVGGTVAGVLIGGLVGNQVGGGDGRKAATAAGAVAGGFIGNRVDRRHVGGRVVARTDRQCRTVSDQRQSSRVVGYDVTYRQPDGGTGSRRMSRRPGSRIPMGERRETIGYDVTYRYAGVERTVRMDERPAQRLPVVDGQVVLATAALDSDVSRS